MHATPSTGSSTSAEKTMTMTTMLDALCPARSRYSSSLCRSQPGQIWWLGLEPSQMYTPTLSLSMKDCQRTWTAAPTAVLQTHPIDAASTTRFGQTVRQWRLWRCVRAAASSRLPHPSTTHTHSVAQDLHRPGLLSARA